MVRAKNKKKMVHWIEDSIAKYVVIYANHANGFEDKVHGFKYKCLGYVKVGHIQGGEAHKETSSIIYWGGEWLSQYKFL